MTLLLMEEAVSKLKTYISTNMTAKVAALNAAYADAITLADISAYHTSEVIESSVFPICEILGLDSEMLSESASDVDMSHHIMVIITVRDDVNKQNLRTRMYRYGRALVELARAWRGSGGDGYILEFDSPALDFSPLVRNQSLVLGDVTMNVRLVKPELA